MVDDIEPVEILTDYVMSLADKHLNNRAATRFKSFVHDNPRFLVTNKDAGADQLADAATVTEPEFTALWSAFRQNLVLSDKDVSAFATGVQAAFEKQKLSAAADAEAKALLATTADDTLTEIEAIAAATANKEITREQQQAEHIAQRERDAAAQRDAELATATDLQTRYDRTQSWAKQTIESLDGREPPTLVERAKFGLKRKFWRDFKSDERKQELFQNMRLVPADEQWEILKTHSLFNDYFKFLGDNAANITLAGAQLINGISKNNYKEFLDGVKNNPSSDFMENFTKVNLDAVVGASGCENEIDLLRFLYENGAQTERDGSFFICQAKANDDTILTMLEELVIDDPLIQNHDFFFKVKSLAKKIAGFDDDKVFGLLRKIKDPKNKGFYTYDAFSEIVMASTDAVIIKMLIDETLYKHFYANEARSRAMNILAAADINTAQAILSQHRPDGYDKSFWIDVVDKSVLPTVINNSTACFKYIMDSLCPHGPISEPLTVIQKLHDGLGTEKFAEFLNTAVLIEEKDIHGGRHMGGSDYRYLKVKIGDTLPLVEAIKGIVADRPILYKKYNKDLGSKDPIMKLLDECATFTTIVSAENIQQVTGSIDEPHRQRAKHNMHNNPLNDGTALPAQSFAQPRASGSHPRVMPEI